LFKLGLLNVGSNTTLIAKNVNSASFDSVHETVNGDKK